MPPDTQTSADAAKEPPVLDTLRRFLPYLWPDGRPDLKLRICGAMLMVLLGKAAVLSMPFAYKAAIDSMTIDGTTMAMVAITAVLAYGAARLGSVLFDNLRNVVFERVGQEATRTLAENVFVQLHTLSLRFHLARRTGEVTKVIERGTKS
ncbi:MAG: ABC transporter transmembrane domain-containing protein, partial [Sphingopyxis sp.]